MVALPEGDKAPIYASEEEIRANCPAIKGHIEALGGTNSYTTVAGAQSTDGTVRWIQGLKQGLMLIVR